MPKRTDLKKIMVIGSGPIVIGQAAEFDYAGTQACYALREEGYEVILVNSNPATIMTDKESADRVYIEPLTPAFLESICRKERPDAILPTLGGQTGLNLAMELEESGFLQKLNIELLGTPISAIKQAEDREAFKHLMETIQEPIPESEIVHTVEAAVAFAKTIGFPLIVRPAFTLGGTGGGMCDDEDQLIKIVSAGLALSPVNQCLVERSIAGYKEIEFEVMRDHHDNAIVVCNMENFDPVGIHTGDSIVFAPVQTLTDVEVQMLRDASLKIIRALKIEGGCNVQLALDQDSYKYYIIEVNPRVSRSSALASKATGYPIAKIAAKIAVGISLDEMINPVTKTTYAQFEPALDYVVSKIPRWPFDKFEDGARRLGTQMKATGEVMAMGRSLESSLLKAVRSLEIGCMHLSMKEHEALSESEIMHQLIHAQDDRLFVIYEAMKRGLSDEEIHAFTKIDLFFLDKVRHILDIETQLKHDTSDAALWNAKFYGFHDQTIAHTHNTDEKSIRDRRHQIGCHPVFKMVDTCAGEFESSTPYFYSTYEEENESEKSDRKKVVVLGSGPIRIGQGIEFDYATVHSVRAIQAMGYEAIVINSNPETVSTDFSVADKLYFEPLTAEDVLEIIKLEDPMGVIVQFGGQTAINLAQVLEENGVTLIGTRFDDLDRAEDRDRFEAVLTSLNIERPKGGTARSTQEAIHIADSIGYPALVRPSYVLGGRAMQIVSNTQELENYMRKAVKASDQHPVLIDRYIQGVECDVDALCDGTTVLIPGIMEHIERSGVHSGDSMAIYPPQNLSPEIQDKIVEITQKLAIGLNCIGIMNVQYIICDQEVYVIEVNPRASRTVPFLSKITNIPMAQVATRIILGESLVDQGYVGGLVKAPSRISVKAPVFSFGKLDQVDAILGPEMKSTGEVMGSDTSLEKALYKAFVASGMHIPEYGKVFVTVDDHNKEEVVDIAKDLVQCGFDLIATHGTADCLERAGLYVQRIEKLSEGLDIVQTMKNGDIAMVVNTIGEDKTANSDGFRIRKASIEYRIPLFTSLDTARAITNVIKNSNFSLERIG